MLNYYLATLKMVFLTFADNSTHNIPLKELQLIPYFKDMPELTEDSQKLDLSFNEIFTYGNIIRCIVFSDSVNDSYKNLLDYFSIDNKYYDKNMVKEVLNMDLIEVKNNDVDKIILRCQIYNKCLIENYEEIFKLPIDVIKQCITKENINIQSNNNDDEEDDDKTVLIYAIENNRLDIIKLLIDAGANTNIQDISEVNNETALMIASLNGHIDIVKFLINETNANVNLQDDYNNNYTALMYASIYNNIEIVKILIEAGANVNIQDNDGNTALISASEDGYTKIVKLLIEAWRAGESVALPAQGGEASQAPLSGAEGALLPQAGANVNIQNNDGNTALMRASCKKHIEIVKILIEAGADINIQNNDDKTALMLASQYGRIEVVKLLKE